MFEILESRTFLSATGVLLDVKALKSQELALKAAITLEARQGVSDFKLIEADLKRLSLTKTDKSLIATLKKDGTTLFAKLATNTAHDIGLVNTDLASLISADARAVKSHANPKLEAIVTADQTRLSAAVTAARTAIDADTASQVTTLSADLTALASTTTDTQAKSDIATTRTDLSTNAVAIDTQIITVITDVNTVLGDLSL
jgi:hypothetical protein